MSKSNDALLIAMASVLAILLEERADAQDRGSERRSIYFQLGNRLDDCIATCCEEVAK